MNRKAHNFDVFDSTAVPKKALAFFGLGYKGALLLLLSVLYFLQMVDAVGTHILVSSGIVQEGNALISNIVLSGNFITLKAGGTLACVVLLYLFGHRFPKGALLTSLAAVIIYDFVLISNAVIIARL